MAQNAVAYLCEMVPMAKLKCVSFLIIYVLYIGTIFTKVSHFFYYEEYQNFQITTFS